MPLDGPSTLCLLMDQKGPSKDMSTQIGGGQNLPPIEEVAPKFPRGYILFDFSLEIISPDCTVDGMENSARG